MTTPLRLGTRKSLLALWQANHVAALLRPLAAPRAVELVLIETLGDLVRDKPLSQIGGDGLFTKEIQHALLDGRADVAVHSLKDLPTEPEPALTLAAVPPRGPVGDAFVSTKYRAFADLPHGATVATSSLRRQSQMRNRRPDLRIKADFRGNVETRLRKLDDEGLDAIILAEAGLVRLKLADRITQVIEQEWMLPAVGQGALGLECRADDKTTRGLLASLDDPATHAAVVAERAFLRALGGGCVVPIGALATMAGGTLTLRGCVLSPDGARRVDGVESGGDAEAVGQALAARMLGMGAGELLKK